MGRGQMEGVAPSATGDSLRLRLHERRVNRPPWAGTVEYGAQRALILLADVTAISLAGLRDCHQLVTSRQERTPRRRMSSEPTPESVRIDKVRASREGHTYHDTWTARVALELLVPTTSLSAVAVEGLFTEDAHITSSAATEIADLVRYRSGVGIAQASSVEVVQFKYSIAEAAVPMRATDVRKTLAKFARTDNDFTAAVGADRVRDVARYELVTNRPFHSNLLEAIDALRRGLALHDDVADQATAVADACGLERSLLPGFLERLTLTGHRSMVSEVKASVHRTIANWGGATDTLSRMRLSNLLQLCREKAGAVGQFNNLISRVDILAALEIAHEDELYPTPDAFPAVGPTIDRSIVDTVASTSREQGIPILVHSPGGMGKTVIMQALARQLQQGPNAVVLFDCFGAGRWRDPADGRHLVQRALPHVANLLAGRGLCDVLLPGGAKVDIAQAFRARLGQVVSALREVDSSARLVLLLDAIDHSALQAAETHTDAFSHVILKSLSIAPVDGVSVVASCRTERRDIARNGAECREIPIGPFLPDETMSVVLLRDETATEAEIAALHTRSGGNPRVLDALLRTGRPYDELGPREGGLEVRGDLLDELLTRRIEDASREALSRGLSQRDVDTLLAGLALLPPPVPVTELAAALERPDAAVESFAADLSPLIDRTPHGLIFRDEPTETLIRRLFQNDSASQTAIIERLERRQLHSTYAARALPIVLTSVGRTDDLVRLAFDARLPGVATSRVAQRAIRLSRLVAALVACSADRRADDLTELLLEAARVAGGHERSDAFLLEHPDLVGVSGDAEAVRRLFEVKSGWPGSRHASLAVLYALSNEPGEARRNARRALAWLDWRARQPRDRSHLRERTSTEEQDLVGPAYVEALAGNTTRVGRWLDQWSEPYAYTLYSQLAQLLERHAVLSPDAAAARRSLIHRAVRCRSKSRALAAALLQHTALEAGDALRVVRRLASISVASGPVPDDSDYTRRDHGLADALVAAAMRAVRLGQDAEAKAILDRVGIRRLRLHHFGSHWSNTAEIRRFLSAAAVRSALERRSPHLMDVAPEEIHSALRFRNLSPTAREYQRAVERLLKPPQEAPPLQRKRRKPRLESKEREEAIRVLDHRIRPLLPFVSAVSRLLRTQEPDVDVAAALDELARSTTSAESYPYRDGPQYMALVAFGLVMNSVDALDALSAETSSRIVEWLLGSAIQYTSLWIDVVAVLSRRPDTRAAALALAKRTSAMIQSDTNIRDRITANGALARAIWRTSRAEAQAHFRRGLDIADAIGSDDYDRAADLIEFAARYEGAPLAQETVHTLARICELTLHDEDKFPWTNFGEAMARIGGLHALSIVARLADREKASLALSLPPLLTSLVRHGRMEPDTAVGLFGLDSPAETWSWNVVDFAKAVVPYVTPALRAEAMHYVLTEIDRRYQGRPSRQTLQGLADVCRAHLGAGSVQLQRIEALIAARGQEDTRSRTDPALRTPVLENNSWQKQGASVDPFDPAAIDAALVNDGAESVGRPAVQLLSVLAERVHGVDDQLRFLGVVADTRVPTLADKLLALEGRFKAWRERSMALADAMPTFVTELASRHADELIGSEWESSFALRKLIEFSGEAPLRIVASIIEALRGRATDVGGSAWMNFACVAARTASGQAIGAALDRFASMAALDLPEEFADGSWRTDLATDEVPLPSIAGVLWMRLGSPSAADRWRAAHCVRRLVAMAHGEVIDALAARFDNENAGPFQDQQLPFFFLHARFWLLVAIARIAIDRPEAVLSAKKLLERIAFDTEMPHAGMQAFAADGLRALLGVVPPSEAIVLRVRLEAVGASPFPRAPENKMRKDFYHSSRRQGEAEPENPFHFEYDYSKTEVDGLGLVFGLDHSDVVSLATTWVRRWSKDVKNMWECPRRPHSEYGDWSNRRPGRHAWGAYLAWHALMLTAGELLQKRPVSDRSYRDEPWIEWLADYRLSRSDGLWLADATELFPPDVTVPVVAPDVEVDVPTDPRELGSLVGLPHGRTISDYVTIDGSWKSEDGLDVSVDSVVVVPELAEMAAFTVLTVDPFDRWFPREEDMSRGFRRRLPLRRLFREPDYGDRKLDEDDPYASPTAFGSATPARAAFRLLRLQVADSVGRVWRNSGRADVFRSCTWGVEREGRDGNSGRYGSRLRVSTGELLGFLRSTRRSLVLLVRVQKYLKGDDYRPVRPRKRRRTDGEREIPFRTQTLVAIIDPGGHLRVVRRIPRAVREAVSNMSEMNRHEFGHRLVAIVRSQLGGRRIKGSQS